MNFGISAKPPKDASAVVLLYSVAGAKQGSSGLGHNGLRTHLTVLQSSPQS